MKQVVFFLLLILTGGALYAQGKTDDQAPYKKDPTIPAFTIQLTDSTWFTKEQLPKYNRTILIYFSPDCGHCQEEAKDIVQHMDSLKSAFFVFIAYKPLDDIKSFAAYYGLDRFPNVRIGRDPKYFVPAFYRVKYTPFLAVYDKNGQLESVFDTENTPVPDAAGLVALVNRN
ncbi:MAG: redoxin domain-containing protein [Chitinophagaceae bacterium]|nr:redoxin domain-containing protein [Chitinophagaceae bacterium]MCA6453034.1 redoxin domain-containing protein [Chitinophagaceae bacterium]MCA6456090.1 redoxin domain-containing protein [Chitinophagaceae bacterium]MCA6458140.1 redoxin domain-containing protein [Chitinophagaceae bacterium]MCA6463853.1 redoxin domain-containing protein [Chitinophagaceae bacterium]